MRPETISAAEIFSAGSAGRLSSHSRTASTEDAGIAADVISTEKVVFPAPHIIAT
jgi:hypothetical protein